MHRYFRPVFLDELFVQCWKQMKIRKVRATKPLEVGILWIESKGGVNFCFLPQYRTLSALITSLVDDSTALLGTNNAEKNLWHDQNARSLRTPTLVNRYFSKYQLLCGRDLQLLSMRYSVWDAWHFKSRVESRCNAIFAYAYITKSVSVNIWYFRVE